MNLLEKILAIFRRPVERRYVFIITYGRSGSTLLMNLINSCEGCCVRGENNSALHGLYQSYRRIVDAQRDHGKNAHLTRSPWWGISAVNPDGYAHKLVNSFIDEVIMPGPHDVLCGFKEIRFSPREVPDLKGYVEFISNFFPGAKIIFNHRNLDDVAASKWWAAMPNALDFLAQMESRFKEFEKSEDIFHFCYDTAMQDISHVQDMFRFLSIPFDEVSVGEVFAQRHSY